MHLLIFYSTRDQRLNIAYRDRVQPKLPHEDMAILPEYWIDSPSENTHRMRSVATDRDSIYPMRRRGSSVCHSGQHKYHSYHKTRTNNLASPHQSARTPLVASTTGLLTTVSLACRQTGNTRLYLLRIKTSPQRISNLNQHRASIPSKMNERSLNLIKRTTSSYTNKILVRRSRMPT